MRQRINEWKEQNLPRYCESCDARCCSLNLGLLTRKQVSLIYGDIGRKEMTDIYDFEEENGLVRAVQREIFKPKLCPCVQGNRCIIYDHPDRPMECREFPFYRVDETEKRIVIDNYTCPATILQNIAELCLEAISAGYTVEYAFGFREITRRQLIGALRYK